MRAATPTRPQERAAGPQVEPAAGSPFHLTGGKGACLFLALTVLVAVVVFWKYLLLQSAYIFKDIGSDTNNLFYPQLVHVSDYLREYGFPPTWSFRVGMGQNILPFTVGDPFNWVLYALGRGRLEYGIAYVEVLKIVLGGLFAYCFFRTLKLSAFASIVGGILYSFSGFMIVGGGWYVFSSEAVFVALLFYAFELFYSRGRWQLLPIAVFLTGANLPFNLFPYGLLLLGYSVFRYALDHGKDFRGYLPWMSRVLALSLIGCGMSAFFSVSGVHEMVNSQRVSGEASLIGRLSGALGLEDSVHYSTALLRTFSSDLLGTGSKYSGWYNYLEAPLFYCGLLSLLLAPQVFGCLTRRQRLLFGALALAAIAPVVFPFLRYAYWCFAGDYYRGFSLAVVGGLLYFAVHALHEIERRERVNGPTLAATLVVLTALLFLPTPKSVTVDSTLRISLVVLLVLEAGLVLLLARPELRLPAKVGLLALVCVEAAFLSSVGINSRPVLAAAEIERRVGYNDYTVEALAQIRSRDAGFYRTDKDYHSGLAQHPSINDARIQGFFGTPTYHSFNQSSYIAFLGEMGVLDTTDEKQTRWVPGLHGRPLLECWSSHRYSLSKTGGRYLSPWYEKIGQAGDVEIYESRLFLPLGFTYEKVLPLSSFRRLDLLQRDIALLRAAVIADAQMGRFSGFEILKAEDLEGEYTVDHLREDVARLRESSLRLEEFSEYRLRGVVNVDRRKVMFFTIPYDKGWSVRVDGREVPTRKVNIGFIGLTLAPGRHEVDLRFSPPWFGASFLISLISLLLYGSLFWRATWLS